LCVKDKGKKTIKEEAHASSQGAPFLLLSFVFPSFLISLHAQESVGINKSNNRNKSNATIIIFVKVQSFN
jgi:hypothetical protein